MTLRLVILCAMLAMSACTLPRSGPLAPEIRNAAADRLTIVPLSQDAVAMSRRAETASYPSLLLAAEPVDFGTLSAGDRVSVTIIESTGTGQFPSVVNGMLKLEALDIDQNGSLFVPYAGSVPAAGRSIKEIRSVILSRLERKLFRPQVEVRLVEQPQRNVTVYGAVTNGGSHPIAPGMRRLSDLLGAAGVRVDHADQVIIEVRRGPVSGRLPLAHIFEDSRQDIALRPGDVVTVSKASSYVTIMGAAGTQGRIQITGQSFSLLDALASANGLNDELADPSGVFLFRRDAQVGSGPASALIYQFDTRDPNQVFLAGQLQVRDGDVVYVSTASFSQTRKMLSIISGSLGFAARTVQGLP